MRWLIAVVVMSASLGLSDPARAQTCDELEVALPALLEGLGTLNEDIALVRDEVQAAAEAVRRASDRRVELADAFRADPTNERRAQMDQARDALVAARDRLVPLRDELTELRAKRDELTVDIGKVQDALATDCPPPTALADPQPEAQPEAQPEVQTDPQYDPPADPLAPQDPDVAIAPEGSDLPPDTLPPDTVAPGLDRDPEVPPEDRDEAGPQEPAAPPRLPQSAMGMVSPSFDDRADVPGDDPAGPVGPADRADPDPPVDPERAEIEAAPDIYNSVLPPVATGPTPPVFAEFFWGLPIDPDDPERQPFGMLPPPDRPGNGWRIVVDGTIEVEQMQRRGGRRARRALELSEEPMTLALTFDDFGVLVAARVDGEVACTAHGGLVFDHALMGLRFLSADPGTGETLYVETVLSFFFGGDESDTAPATVSASAQVLLQGGDGRPRWMGSFYAASAPKTAIERVTIEDAEICPVW